MPHSVPQWRACFYLKFPLNTPTLIFFNCGPTCPTCPTAPQPHSPTTPFFKGVWSSTFSLKLSVGVWGPHVGHCGVWRTNFLCKIYSKIYPHMHPLWGKNQKKNQKKFYWKKIKIFFNKFIEKEELNIWRIKYTKKNFKFLNNFLKAKHSAKIL